MEKWLYGSTLESFLSRKKDDTYYVLFSSKEFKKLDTNDGLVNDEIFHDMRTDFEDVLIENVSKKLKLM